MKKYYFSGGLLVGLLMMAGGIAEAQRVKYTVQLEATSDVEAAREKVSRFKQQGVDVYIVRSDVPGKGTFFRLRTGVFQTQQLARNFGADLKKRGIVGEYFIAPYEEPRSDWAAAPVTEKKSTPPPAAARPAPSARPETRTPVATPPPPVRSDISIPETGSTVSFVQFKDDTFGFSLDYPKYWEGGPFSPTDLTAQKIDAGAMFKSYQDAAFMNVIWNNVDKANSPDNDNDLIIEVILKSMSAGEGTQQLSETSRKVMTENGNIKTMLGLQAVFKTKGQPEPLDFLGKAVIIRSARGILLAVTFYSKQSQPYVTQIADRIISSVQIQK